MEKPTKTLWIYSGFILIVGLLTSCASKPVKAGDVTDRESLKAFVLSAKKHLEKNYDLAKKDFREKEEWKKDSIYLFVLNMDGTIIFHAVNPSLEGVNFIKTNPEIGDKVTKPLLKAAKDGGDFVEYLWDSPAIAGEDQSLKVGYAVIFKKDGKDHIVGSGFYPKTEKK